MSTTASRAASPAGVSLEPISTRSGHSRSAMAVPSARNSGFESTSKWTPGSPEERTRCMAAAVRTGSVDFSTTMVSCLAQALIWRAVFSQYWRSAARPAPWPKVFVGVFTATKITSASAMALSTSVEKNRLRLSVSRTTSWRPGS